MTRMLRAVMVLWGLMLLLVSAALAIGTLIRAQEITFTAELNGNSILASVDVARCLTAILVYERDQWVYGGKWSPDGTRVAFSSDREVYLLDENQLQQITYTSEFETSLDWFPNGQLISVVYSGDPAHVIQIDLETQHQSGLIDGRASTVAWSSNIANFAYSEVDDISARTYIIDFSTKTITEIIKPNLRFSAPSWSPDGAFLVMSGFGFPQTSDLYIYDLSTNKVTSLTLTSQFYEVMPAWSPDGTQIAFIGGDSVTTDENRLFVINIATGETYQLSDWPALHYPPSWRP